MRPKSSFGEIFVVGGGVPVVWSASRTEEPSSAKFRSFGERRGWLKALLRSAPISNRAVAVSLKNFRIPRFTPHVPGPVRMFRLATLGLSRASAPTGGGRNAAGLKNRSPTLMYWLV